jgi:hypothetical protein
MPSCNATQHARIADAAPENLQLLNWILAGQFPNHSSRGQTPSPMVRQQQAIAAINAALEILDEFEDFFDDFRSS